MTEIKFNLRQFQEPLVIVGLGNIGKEYEQTRHNAGFIFIDLLINALETAGYSIDIKQEAEYTLWTCRELNLNLIKPKLMMNLSGKSLSAYYRYHKHLKSTNLIVAHDDLDLALEDYKINIGKGPRLHNGLRSIESELTVSNFARIRIGIENRNGLPITGLDYVLFKFTKAEFAQIKQCITEIINKRFSF